MKQPIQERQAFNSIKTVMEMPDLVEVQKRSYSWFLREGLRELFDEVSPIRDFIGRDLELRFGRYYLDEPKFDEVASKKNNLSYESPLRVEVTLTNKKTGEKEIKQEVYLGDFPIMTDRGTFIINGVERVIVSQLIRSAGVFFTSELHGERRTYGAKIIPNRGSWLEFETDTNNVIWVKIDRKRKIAATALLRAFGYPNDEDILGLFTDVDTDIDAGYIRSTLDKDASQNEGEALKEIYKRIRPGDMATTDNAKSLIYAMFFNFDRYDFGRVGRYKINQRFGKEIDITPENRVLRVEDLTEVLREIIRLNISQKEPDDIDHLGNRRVRAVGELIQNKFRIGLARMERIIKDRMSTMDISEVTPNRLINARPVIGAVKEFFMSSQLSQFMDQTNPLSELEHKRRLSAMGPGGLSRERAGFDVRDVHPTHYGRICPIATPEGPNIGLVGHLACFARVNEYGFIETPFRRVKHDVPNTPEQTEGESLRMDVLKPGTETVIAKSGEPITAKLAKELAGYKDILTIPIKPRVTNEIIYLTAFQSESAVTTAATTPIDEKGFFVNPRAEVRKYGDPEINYVEVIDYMDVAPNQIVSVTTSLIPFLEHDDAVRALMGSNMQRQAVTLLNPQSPVVGTGLERRAGADSGHVVLAPDDGVERQLPSTSTNLFAPTPRPVLTSVRLSRRGRKSKKASRWPTVLRPTRVNSHWDKTSCAASWLGKGTTSKTP
jgi:DNA-directed RNA polymerase subunit beta